jgi:hypothetical protein
MPRRHVGVESLDGGCPRHLPVLLVHVVRAGTRVVSDPHAEVLDLLQPLLLDLSKSSSQPCLPQNSLTLDSIAVSRTWFKLTTSPLVFFTFRSLPRKYQNRDLATTSFGANIRMRYSLGVGLESVGRCRPMIWYSLRRPVRISMLANESS